jgi:ribosomal protein S18 acetylase RimI-like enzyme
MLWLGESRHKGIMPGMEPVVRPARPDDEPAAGLLYVSAAPYYDRYAGGEERARRLLAAVYPRDGHTASWEVCRVALVGDAVAGVLAAFPVADGEALARRFIRLTLGRIPPWRLPALMRHLRASAAVSPQPPNGMLYVDALAVDPAWRRRGVARALLAEADRMAEQHGLPGVALDTGIENRAARSLYQHAGYEQRGLRPVPDERSARAIGGSGFVGYVKRRP